MNVSKGEELPSDLLARALEETARLVAVPSVAAEGRGMAEGANMVEEILVGHGYNVELHPTAGATVVYAEKIAPSGAPTILFYNHYDVQPADPIDAWESDPFVLTERNGKVYGRGTSDDKGEFTSRLAALAWFERRHGPLPFGVKFVVEGEEEIGSPNLSDYVSTYKDTLQADVGIWEFGGVDADGRPMTYCGLKGILTVELSVRTAGHDLHSSYGAVVENPIYRLASALSSLRDDDGRVLIDGFYDDVVEPTDGQRELVRDLPPEDPGLRSLFGVEEFLGRVSGAKFSERLYFEPNVNYNGFTSGYSGPGSKTVLPAEAGAKLDFRLVPNQDPHKLIKQLQNHLTTHGFSDVEMKVLEHAEHPARADIEHPWVRSTVAALRDVYGKEPVVYPNSAGSGPMYPFIEELGIPVVGMGIGYPGSRLHSPNEHFRLADYKSGVAALVRLFEIYGLTIH